MSAIEGRGPWAIDTHAHLYPFYDLTSALDGAVANFEREAPTRGVRCLLLVADPVGVDSRDLLDRHLGEPSCDWQVACAGATFRWVQRRDGVSILVVRGRQIATRERFEVLAFDDVGASAQVAEGDPLVETLRRGLATCGLVIVPWGFGKWWFRRRHLLAEALDGGELAGAFVGDSGARPALGRRSPIFRRATALGVAILPGSDPLPTVGQEGRLGSSGILFEADIESARPVASLVEALRQPHARARGYRRGMGPIQFVRSQWALRRREVR